MLHNTKHYIEHPVVREWLNHHKVVWQLLQIPEVLYPLYAMDNLDH